MKNLKERRCLTCGVAFREEGTPHNFMEEKISLNNPSIFQNGTPTGILVEGMEFAKDMKHVVVCYMLENGDYGLMCSNAKVTEVLGVLEASKFILYEKKIRDS